MTPIQGFSLRKPGPYQRPFPHRLLSGSIYGAAPMRELIYLTQSRLQDTGGTSTTDPGPYQGAPSVTSAPPGSAKQREKKRRKKETQKKKNKNKNKTKNKTARQQQQQSNRTSRRQGPRARTAGEPGM